jgi:predicted oxidoreductase
VLAPADPAEAIDLAAAARGAGAAQDATGGLRTDAAARVLDASGLSIPGLYAVEDSTDAQDAGARAAARAATRAP